MEAHGHTSPGTSRSSTEVIGGATATHSTADYRETVGFDSGGRLVFETEPIGPSTATLIVASSLFAEFQRNYRREVLLSRRAAAAGIRTLRCHYRGTGNSIASDGPADLDSMSGDLRTLLDGVEGPVALLGTRVGAIAAARARATANIPLILWEPVIRGDRWVEEVIRAALAREIGQGTGVTADTIRSRWNDNGVAFVLGETVPKAVVDQVAGSSLVDVIDGPGPIQVVQMARSDKIKADVARLTESLGARGVDVEVLPVVGSQAWWINEGGDLFRPVERDDAIDRLVDGIITFVRKVCR